MTNVNKTASFLTTHLPDHVQTHRHITQSHAATFIPLALETARPRAVHRTTAGDLTFFMQTGVSFGNLKPSRMNNAFPRWFPFRWFPAASVLLVPLLSCADALKDEFRSAVYEGNAPIVARLLDDRPELINGKDDSTGFSPLHSAVFKERTNIVLMLLKCRADVNSRTQGGSTPLHLAADRDQKPLAKLLLSYRADINTQDSEGLTPLNRAVLNRNFRMAEYLISRKADVNIPDKSNRSPLYFSAWYGVPGMISLLLANGANPSPQSYASPMHIAADHGFADSLKAFLDNGVPIDLKDSIGRTPLHCATRAGETNASEFLIRAGANVNAVETNTTRCTPLHHAAGNGMAGVVALLLGRGADASVRDNYDNTPLHSCRANPEIIKALLSHGASAGATNKYGYSPLFMVARTPNVRIDTVELLLTNGANVNAASSYGECPLLGAIGANNKEVVELLLRFGADVNVVSSGKNFTPLMLAVHDGHSDFVRLLLDRKADVLATDRRGCTALHFAALRRSVEDARLLLASGAEINAKDGEGRTPMDWADLYRDYQKEKSDQMIQFLRSCGGRRGNE